MPCAKPTWINSIGLKVLLAYVAGVVLSIVLMLAVLTLMTKQSDYLVSTDVSERAYELAEMLQFDRAGMPIGFDNSEGDRNWMYESLKQEIAYRVLDAAGNVVLVSADRPAAFWPANRETHPLKRGPFTFQHEGLAMYGGTEIIHRDGKVWVLQFAASARMMDVIQNGFALPFMGAGIVLFSLVLLFVFGACAYFTLGYTLKPLREVSESAAAISPRSLHARLQVETVPAEIAPLVDSFNRVLERLEHGYRVQQGFLATAAHELKTPLALIRAQIELTEHGADRDSLLSDVQHMTRQVQQLLLLAEASEVQNYIFAEVDVQDVAREAVGYLQRMVEAANVRLIAPDDVPGVRWQADRAALFTLLKNLLENAIQHAPEGTAVCVAVGADTVTVRDWGPGVEPEQLSQLFVRFWRGAHRRDHGAGLGLAICQEVARAHGWTLTAHRVEPGLLFRIAMTNATA